MHAVRQVWRKVLVIAVGAAAIVVVVHQPAGAASVASVGLGTAKSFAVLAGSTVTNTGASVVNGDLGVSPGTAITGFPPGQVRGTIHAADAVAANAQADLTTAYNNAAGRPRSATVTANLGGQTLVGGVYFGDTLALTGTLTLNAEGNANAVWIFQSNSTLKTASSSSIVLENGGSPCNVFWQVKSSATLGTDSLMVGTVMALTSITANTRAKVTGRLLSRNAATTLDTNTFTRLRCSATPPSTTTTTRAGGTTTTTRPGGTTTTTTRPGGTTTTTRRGGGTTTTTRAGGTTTTTRVGGTTTTRVGGGGGGGEGGGGGTTSTIVSPGPTTTSRPGGPAPGTPPPLLPTIPPIVKPAAGTSPPLVINRAGELARTGDDTLGQVLVAMAALAIGAALTFHGRRTIH